MHRLGVAVFDRVLCRLVGELADEDPAHRRSGLDPGGRVDDVAGRHPVALARLRVEHHERLAGRDPDADLEVEPGIALVQARQRVSNCEAGQHCALGVVLSGDRSPEEREHGVADELLHRAAEALELGAHASVIRPEHRANVLGIELLGARGRADDVDEEPGDELALLARRRGLGERRAARQAEARDLRVVLTALGTKRHRSSVRPWNGRYERGRPYGA